MAKKRAKVKTQKQKNTSRKKPIERKSKMIQENHPPSPIHDALKELEILAEEKKVEHKVDQLGKKEASMIVEEKKLEQETKKVEELEKEIKKEMKEKPLSSFDMKDLNKGILGAFIGVVAHFGFIYGKAIAKYITVTRASILFIFSYAIIIILMYETGYRDIREKRLFGILPRRATFIYLTSLIVVVVIFFLFNMLDYSDLTGLYKEIAVTSVLASVGAGTADLIGRD